MAPDIHVDPDRLHVHGRRLAEVLGTLGGPPELDPATRVALASTGPGTAVLAVLDRAAAVLDRANHELGGLTAALHGAASAAVDADHASAGAFRRIAADLG